MLALYFFLFAAAVSILFLFEESTATHRAVSLLAGICLAAMLTPLLPEEWGFEAIPHGYGRAKPRALLFLVLAYAIGYPVTTRLLYPLRNRLMERFDARYGKGR